MIVGSVEKDSPAEKAGIKKYDVITALDGQAISSRSELQAVLYQKQIGDKLEVTYYRDGSKKTANVTLDQDSSKLLEKQEKQKEEAASSEKSIFNQ